MNCTQKKQLGVNKEKVGLGHSGTGCQFGLDEDVNYHVMSEIIS